MVGTSKSFGALVLSALVDFIQAVSAVIGHAIAALLRPVYPSVSVVRAKDHLLLRFEFVNLSRKDVIGEEGEPAQVLVPKGGVNSYLIVHFPPQNLAEQAFFQTDADFPTKGVPGSGDVDQDPAKDPNPEQPTNTTPPVDTRLAGPSRLVFRVPSNADPIPYTLEGLLKACSDFRPAVAPSAMLPEAPSRYGAVFQAADWPALAGQAFLADEALRAGLVFQAAGGPNPAASVDLAEAGARPASGVAKPAEMSLAEKIVQESRFKRWAARSRVAQFVPEAADKAVSDTLADAAAEVKPLPALRPPTSLETAIETPYRLILSPHRLAAWAHALSPVVSSKGRSELWHTRVAVWLNSQVYERPHYLQALRAIWARDPSFSTTWEQVPPRYPFDPFRMSLDASDRHQIVHLSGNHRLFYNDPHVEKQQRHKPLPISVWRLMLSSLGAWMDTRGAWDPPEGLALEEWRHRGTMGRDHYVRVVYRGFLFPFGHRASLIKITERKFHHELDGNPAFLRQRMFIVVREPEKSYPNTGLETPAGKSYDRQWPVVNLQITTLVTPKLDNPQPNEISPDTGQNAFWPRVNSADFLFHFIGEDLEGNEFEFSAPLIFVSTENNLHKDQTLLGKAALAYAGVGEIDLDGQTLTFAPSQKPGDTGFETQSLTFGAEIPNDPTYASLCNILGPGIVPRFYPAVRKARIQIPAVQHLAGKSEATEVTFNQTYLASGFAAAHNKGQVFFDLPGAGLAMSFDAQGDRSGGLVKPNTTITGLSRLSGPVGGTVANIAGGTFDPEDFFGESGAKVFGVIDLWDLIDALGIPFEDAVPKFITEALTPLQALATFVESFKQKVDSVGGLGTVVSDVSNDCTAVLGDLADIISDLPSLPAAPKVEALKTDLNGLLTDLEELESKLPGASGMTDELRRDVEKGIARLEKDLADVDVFVGRLVQALQTITELTVRFEWKPKICDWPSADPLFVASKNGTPASLTIAAEMAAKSGLRAAPSFDVSCSLENFTLDLIGPLETFLLIRFDKLQFFANSAKKADVNVEIDEIVFAGVLSFVEELKKLIPLDGFSDPPSLDVTAEGVKASFSLALPDVSFGVFVLQNLSLGASLTVPFLIDPLSLRFNFCDRHSPFLLTVSALGGGGFFALTLDPGGFQMLEAALEFGACVAMSFAVASGSLSVVAGIYFKLEKNGDQYGVTLIGYFRLRGEVDVLGIISASIELYLEMRYESATGKVVGKATLTIEISVFFFSASVSITCERKFAGSDGDPTFADLMAPYTDPALGYVEPWVTYCEAFA